MITFSRAFRRGVAMLSGGNEGEGRGLLVVVISLRKVESF
jgi:hypothetical protein